MSNRTMRARWHRLYFALAAFDLITVSFSLYVNHRLMQVYTDTVDENRVWSARLNGYSEIALLAAEVNAPGNDVFQTLDVDEAANRLEEVRQRFEERTVEARNDLVENVPADVAEPLIHSLNDVDRAMEDMVGEARTIFALFRAGELSKAGPRMAVMDKQYFEVTRAAGTLIRRVQVIQESRFVEQTALARSMRVFEYVIAGFIALMVLGVTAYGNRMSREISRNHARMQDVIGALRESEGRLRSVLDTAVDGIAIMDEQGRIESLNAAAEQITGWKAAEVVGKSMGILAAPPHGEKHDAYVQNYLRTGEAKILGQRREEIGQRKDGSTFPLYLAVSEVRVGDRRLFTGIIRDITKLKAAEETIRRHSDILEQTVEERTAELASAKNLAEQNNRAKSVFLANMSHELRTPLHGILSFASFGIRRHAVATPAKVREYFEMIERSGQTLLTLLNDLLDLSKLESGSEGFEFEPTNIGELIESVIAEFEALAAERKVKVLFPDPGFTAVGHVDSEKIKQVLRNLLSNAVKFSPLDGVVKITIGRSAETLIISLRDQGPGVPEDELDSVFDKFVQSSKTRTGAGGTGLGLAICRQLVAAHHGRIWAENNPDRGTTFKLKLPLRRLRGMEQDPAFVEMQDDQGRG